MIILREAMREDIKSLQLLSKIAAENHPGFLNMAYDADQWREKIKLSTDSFHDKLKNKFDGKYFFVAEDTEQKKIIGLSMIAAQHGTNEIPHFFFEVGSEKKYSETINTGFLHGTLKLKFDTDGPTEIGGLLVSPEYRNVETRVGRQISFARFLYMAIHRSKFKRRLHAELLPPVTKKGKSTLWEAIGRRFTNLEYPEADELSSKNKEFILSLFPTGKIYIAFLSADARNAIGKVSKDTEPVLHMLKKIGFKYKNQVDPFDGGPHLQANFDEVLPIKKTKEYKYLGDIKKIKGIEEQGLITQKNSSVFKAVSVQATLNEQGISFAVEAAKQLGIKIGDVVYFMPYY